MHNSKKNPVLIREMKMEIIEKKMAQIMRVFAEQQNNQMNTIRIIGRILATIEVMKEKGMYTDEEVKAKLQSLEAGAESARKQQLDAERDRIVAEQKAKSDADEKDPAPSPVQPESAGVVENPSGHPQLRLL
jgi:hypothetical protein